MGSRGKLATAVRGASWRREETLDLIAIWGERAIQERLSQSARNGDIYQEIAQGMAARGHSKSMEACRTKAKNLRKDYKRVLAHNAKSGVEPATCPFFQELQQIFVGDGSVMPTRLVQSLSREALPPPRTGRMGASSSALAGTENNGASSGRLEPPLMPGSVAGVFGGEQRHGECLPVMILSSVNSWHVQTLTVLACRSF